jgi:GNAT superfamily N-acetyltransferase
MFVEIREATAADVDELCQLLEGLFAQESEFQPDRVLQQRGLKRILGDNTVGTVLVAVRHGQVVGMVNILYSVSTALGARVALLEDLVVAPSARRFGIGTALMGAALGRCQDEGCMRTTLLTDCDNGIAHRLYERLGFERSSMVVYRRLVS